jgi:glycosyltransferase involved in cell wall biosynthesis
MTASPRVALVYDRVTTPYGGAEHVLTALHQMFPNAPLYTSVYDPHQTTWAKNIKVIPSFLNTFPLAKKYYRWLAQCMPLAFESFDLSQFDIVISVSSAEAKGVLTKPHQLHINYLLTPTRYLFSHSAEYIETLPKLPGLKFLARLNLNYLKRWDQTAAYRPDQIWAISKLVGARATHYYHREADRIVYPPVEPLSFSPSSTPASIPTQPYYLVVSRLVDYKRIDLCIQACAQLNRPLVIVGDGPAKSKLIKLARQIDTHHCVHFMGSVPRDQLASIYSGAKAVLMPGIEDYGITALEAVATGIPAILHHQSGAAELLSNGKDCILLDDLTQQSLEKALLQLEKTIFNSSQLKKNLHKYATTNFCDHFKEAVMASWQKHLRERMQ